MKPAGGAGIIMFHRNYGVIEKCPFCTATNIERGSRHQITCGKLACTDKQRKSTAKKHLAIKKARQAQK